MSTVSDAIIELLQDDIVSHGWVAQSAKQFHPSEANPRTIWEQTLAELLAGEVEIGETNGGRPDYVEFIAWRGSIEVRIARAMKSVDAAAGWDKEFAYWLCLSKNVDRYE